MTYYLLTLLTLSRPKGGWILYVIVTKQLAASAESLQILYSQAHQAGIELKVSVLVLHILAMISHAWKADHSM